MTLAGPRPALWNQEDLIAERDKYGANDVKPGLTGWAQINGRDELEIPVKAKLDGDYVKRRGFGMDLRCFFGSIFAVLREDGVVEGGTGEMKKKESADGAVSIGGNVMSKDKEKINRGGVILSCKIEGYRLYLDFLYDEVRAA